MTALRHSTCACALAWSLAVAAPASGQDMAATFAQVREVVKPGDTVYVADVSGREIKGTLGSLSRSSLELIGGATFLERDVRQIRVERKDPPWRGALIGLAAVGGPWLVICASDDAWCEYGEYGAENLFRNIAIVTTAMGAAVGALIDWSIKEKAIAYRGSAQRSVTVGISPLLTPARAGIQISTRF